MRIGTFGKLILMLLILNDMIMIVGTGMTVSSQTLPYYVIASLLLIIGYIFAKYGDKIMPWIFTKLKMRYYIGDLMIDGKYVIVKNYDSPEGDTVTGFSVVKVVPLSPAVDAKDEEKKRLLREAEAFIRAVPTDTIYCIRKSMSTTVDEMLRTIKKEIARIQAKMARARNNPGAMRMLEMRLSQLQKEFERISTSNPVGGTIYVKVFAKGRSEDEVKEKLDNMIEVIKTQVHSLNAIAIPLQSTQLHDLLRAELLGRAVKYVD